MTPERAQALVAALRVAFDGDAEAEQVNGAGRYRFAIVAPRFNGVPHLQRQDEAWRVVDQTLTRDETLDVSLVLTFAPADLSTASNEV